METAGSECKTLFLVFSEVLRFSEGLSNSIDPKILFKCAKVVEDMYIKTVSLGAVKEFESKLDEFWTLQGLKRFPLQYFENAPHLILSRFLCDSKFNDGEVKLAIEEFISYKSKEEFLQVVKKLSHTHHIVTCLMKSVDNGQPSDLKAVVFVEELRKLMINSNGSADAVYSTLKKTVGNDEEGFKLLLKVLCLHDDNELSLHIQELVLLLVCDSLKDWEKTYTYSCVINLSGREFNRIVVRWDSFTNSLVYIVELSIKRLKCQYSGNSYSWTNDPGQERGLSFDEIVVIINKLKAVQEKNNYLIELLHRWRNENFLIIAEDLIRICKIK